MVHSTYDIKINALSSSQDNTNIQTTNCGDYKTEEYKRSEMNGSKCNELFWPVNNFCKYMGCLLQKK
jgi:hypothetical protein